MCTIAISLIIIIIIMNKYVRSRSTLTEMYAGHVACSQLGVRRALC